LRTFIQPAGARKWEDGLQRANVKRLLFPIFSIPSAVRDSPQAAEAMVPSTAEIEYIDFMVNVYYPQVEIFRNLVANYISKGFLVIYEMGIYGVVSPYSRTLGS
jgi:hypothetical protein